MSSAEAQVVFNQSNMQQPPTAAQQGFAQQFDLADPDKAMDSYQRLMHQHTKQQFEMAANSSRRRSSAQSNGPTPSLPSQRAGTSISSSSSS